MSEQKTESNIKFPPRTMKDLMGMRVYFSKAIPHRKAIFLNDNNELLEIVEFGNRKILLRIGRFELAYWRKDKEATQ